MWQPFRTSLMVLVSLTVLTGIVYPLLVTAVAQVVFPFRANGSMMTDGSSVVGSELVGQPFSRPEYFWGRLSATIPISYNAASSTGSNYGPLHPDLAKNAAARLDSLRQYDPGIGPVPVDLVTSSASGLDPHISPAAAAVQVNRVAAVRKMPIEQVQTLVQQCTEPRQFGVLGEPRVNVPKLNLALDAAAGP